MPHVGQGMTLPALAESNSRCAEQWLQLHLTVIKSCWTCSHGLPLSYQMQQGGEMKKRTASVNVLVNVCLRLYFASHAPALLRLQLRLRRSVRRLPGVSQIGRASCRERV